MNGMRSGDKIPTGSDILDELIGGYEIGSITTLFGAAGTGKTNLCLLALIRAVGRGKKIVYVDTEARFSVERLQQITKYANKVLPHVILFTPKSFDEQAEVIARMPLIKNVGLMIVDSISGLYRLQHTKEATMMFKRQIAQLAACARAQQLPVILTAQVYADIETGTIKMVGEKILRNASVQLIELQSINEKKRAIVGEKYVDFTITEKGLLTCP